MPQASALHPDRVAGCHCYHCCPRQPVLLLLLGLVEHLLLVLLVQEVQRQQEQQLLLQLPGQLRLLL
jgi:hypothetical protein